MAHHLMSRNFWNLTSLAGSLPQSATCGGSNLGTLGAPTLPQFLTSNPLPSGYPWGTYTVDQSCPTTMPDTGVTRTYDWTISRSTLAPDGVPVPMMLVNGEFPGPLIEANWGDWIEVNVHNAIEGPEEGTAIHWHGLNQLGTPWADGVPSVGQCPITPGYNLTYRWQANQYGSTWWHSHYASQYGSGVQGAIVIHGPPSTDYDIDLGPVALTDWYHDDYEDIVAKVLAPNVVYRPYADSGLINGKGFYPCANVTQSGNCDNTGGANDNDNGACTIAPSCTIAGLSQFKFTSGKKHLLRLINTGAELFTAFSIDNHTMTVIANDFTPIEPYTTEFVTLSVGQRTDVIVEASGDPSDSYWMRSTSVANCQDTNNPDTRAIIYYENADTSALPSTTGYTLPSNPTCDNDALTQTVPKCAQAVQDPATTFTINMNIETNATGSNVWTMNGVSFEGDYNAPTFLDVAQGKDTFRTNENVYNLGSNSSVRLIVYNQFLADHPMHLHGHDFQVLATGRGTWDGTVTNPSNPQRRDVQQIQAGGSTSEPTYIVLQWEQDNPGVWPFHCHIAWHLSAGMYVNILERPDDIAKLDVPQEYYDTCNTWSNWEQTHVVTEIGSGVKIRSPKSPRRPYSWG